MALNKFGLKELPFDKRDFQLGAFTVLPPLEELPDEFELTTPFPIKNQGDTDYCSAYSSCGVSELQEEVESFPPYSFAGSKEISGNLEEWGQDLRSACKTHIKHGFAPVEHINEAQIGDLRVFSNYSDTTHREALKYRKKSFFAVTGDGDSFDNIKRTIWKYREEKRGIMIGVIWSWRLSDFFLAQPAQSGYGHAMYITGWRKVAGEDYLVVVNSYGEEAGKNGKHLASREVINAFVPRFGAYMFLDYDPEEIKVLMERQEWVMASFWKKCLLYIERIFLSLWKQ